MNIIGIDPGLSGGVAVIPLYDFRRTTVYSLEHYSLSQLSALFQEFRAGGGVLYEQEKDTHCEVYLEEPQLPAFNTHNSNGFSVQAHKKLARSLGQLEGICIAAGYPPTLLSPRKWQNALGCATKGDKNITKNLAIKVFPFLSKVVRSGPDTGTSKSTITHAQADALLIALYGYLQYQNPTKYPLSVSQNLPTLKIQRKILPLGQEIPEPSTITTGPNQYTTEQFPSMRGKSPPSKRNTPNGSNEPTTLPNRYGPHRPNSRPRST